jgi:hypothetical protein
LRIHGAEHVIDDPILAARVHRLQADEQRALAFGVEQLLQRPELAAVLLDLGRRVLAALMVALEKDPRARATLNG